MTTSNNIVADEVENAMYIPLEGLFVHNDSINYVYKSNGTKQEVEIGISNNNEVIIKQGLEVGDRIYLTVPDQYRDKEVKLLPGMDGKRMPKQEEVPASEVQEAAPGRTMTPEMMQRMRQNGGGGR
jgi:hypothetical protein